MLLHLVASVDADHLVLYLADGTQHSAFPILDSDPWDFLAGDGRLGERVNRPWSLGQLDAALHRHGYQRTTGWREGPTADVTRPA